MPKKSSSQRWLKEHFSDPYVKQAQKAGFRSRATFKLLELQEKYHLFKPGMVVIDLGAAPGGWSQLVSQWVGQKGKVFAVDILAMPPIKSVEFIQGDFTNENIFQNLLSRLENLSVDWVISDMSPNLTGIDSVDQPRSIMLAELALDFALRIIPNHGGFLVKVFQGEGFDALLRDIKKHFQNVSVKKPKASRGRSREIYLLARR